MPATPHDNPRPSRTQVAAEVGHLGHELHNILTVFFGVSDELAVTGPEPLARSLEASIAKTEEVARRLFALRGELRAGERFDPVATARALAASAPELAPLRAHLEREPAVELIGDGGHFEAFLWALAHVARAEGGLAEVESSRDAAGPGPGPRMGWRLALRFGGGKPGAAAWQDLGRAAARLGAELRSSEAGGSMACLFPAAPPPENDGA